MGVVTWAGAAPAEAEEGPRLAALRRYDVLDTPPEAEFDEVVALAADLLRAPVALVSLVDEHRLWSKARVGMDAPEVPRAWAFCDYALHTEGAPLVVPDAAADPRFADNPLVVGGPRIRFYAGVPLLTPDGHALGTVCVLSPEPRPEGLSAAELRRLSSLAAVAMRGLEVRREARQAARFAAEAEARQAREERLRLALDAAGGCAWELHPRTGLSTWDMAAWELFGMPERLAFEDALGLFAHPEDARAVEAAVERALDPAGDGRYAVEHRCARPGVDGRPRWFRSVGQAWFAVENGRRTRAARLVCTSIEVTEQRAAAERQALLVAELNHRVKNTLAVVLALAEQTRRATSGGGGGSGHPAAAAASPALERRRFHVDFQARLLALSRAHDLLTRGAWQATPLAELVRAALAPFAVLGAHGEPPRIEAEGPQVLLAPEPAVALAMALHELATNASKHGALSRPSGRVSLAWGPAPPGGDRAAALDIAWTESGGPPLAGAPVHRGFGLRLLERALARQLGGEVALDYPRAGFAFRLRLPLGDRVSLGG